MTGLPFYDDWRERPCVSCPVILAADELERNRYLKFVSGQTYVNLPPGSGKKCRPVTDDEAQAIVAEHLARECPGAVPLCGRKTKPVLAPIRESEASEAAPAQKDALMEDGQKQCPYCEEWFTPRLSRHVTCAKPRCRQKRHRQRRAAQ